MTVCPQPWAGSFRTPIPAVHLSALYKRRIFSVRLSADHGKQRVFQTAGRRIAHRQFPAAPGCPPGRTLQKTYFFETPFGRPQQATGFSIRWPAKSAPPISGRPDHPAIRTLQKTYILAMALARPRQRTACACPRRQIASADSAARIARPSTPCKRTYFFATFLAPPIKDQAFAPSPTGTGPCIIRGGSQP